MMYDEVSVEFLKENDPTSTPEQLVSFVCSTLPFLGYSLNTTQQNLLTSILPSLIQKMHLSFSVIVLSLRYLKLSYAQKALFSYQSNCCHSGIYSLFIASLMSASKYLDDNTFTNKSWSIVSHIPVQVLNSMEISFLSSLNFNLHTTHLEYTGWLSELLQLSYLAQQQQPQQQQAPLPVVSSFSSTRKPLVERVQQQPQQQQQPRRKAQFQQQQQL